MATPQIAVLSHHRHPRLRYVCAELGRHVGWRFVVTTDPEQARQDRFAAVLHYGVATKEGAFVPAHRFLRGAGSQVQSPSVGQWENGVPLLFPVEDRGHDHLSAIFFALSRYEEYDRPEADAHGRFPATASHAHRHGYLHLPVVAHWSRLLVAALRRSHPGLPPVPVAALSSEPTFDIDQLWAWHHRGWRGMAAGVRDLLTGQPQRALDRLRSRPADDPFLVPLLHLSTLHPRPRPMTLFWLLSDGKLRQDTNPYPLPPEQRRLMRQLAADHQMGIHPSYRASEDPSLLSQECDRFREVFGRRPDHSRQHFLRFRLPATYRELLDAGIGHDHSMGYADAIGWRAGTHRPFRWYDLERERVTSLTVHPFAAMDVTLKNYLGLNPTTARQRLLDLREGLRPFGGPFVLLWHNSSFAPAYGWAGWDAVLRSALEEDG